MGIKDSDRLVSSKKKKKKIGIRSIFEIDQGIIEIFPLILKIKFYPKMIRDGSGGS